MKRPNWYTDETGQMFYPRPYARWERKRRKAWLLKLLAVAMFLALGAMFAMAA